MQEHRLVVVADPAREVLARIIAVAFPADSEIIGAHFSRPPGAEVSRTLLTIRVPTAQRLELVMARLERLVAVRSVAVLDGTRAGRHSNREVCPVP